MCYRCEQPDELNQDSGICSSRRSFVKLSAASALSLGMAYAGAPMGNSIAAEPSRAVISPKPEMC